MKNIMHKMEKEYIISVLQQRGYDNRTANLVTPDLLSLATPLNVYFQNWLNDVQCIQDYSACGYSIFSLMKERGMNYPAAILTIDWLLKEPEKATASLKKGIK